MQRFGDINGVFWWLIASLCCDLGQHRRCFLEVDHLGALRFGSTQTVLVGGKSPRHIAIQGGLGGQSPPVSRKNSLGMLRFEVVRARYRAGWPAGWPWLGPGARDEAEVHLLDAFRSGAGGANPPATLGNKGFPSDGLRSTIGG